MKVHEAVELNSAHICCMHHYYHGEEEKKEGGANEEKEAVAEKERDGGKELGAVSSAVDESVLLMETGDERTDCGETEDEGEEAGLEVADEM